METILVIDDELFMRRLCEDMLALRGFKVLTAENAKEGLAKLEQDGIDVILLDIMMPELSGLEFLPIIKKTDPDVFVIIITAYASLETAIEALKKGAYDYIRKPFRPHELYHSVDRAISLRRVQQENKGLLEDMQRKVKELSSLNRVGQYIHSLLDIDRLLEKVVLSIAAVMGVEVVSVMLLDREAGELTIRASTGIPEEVTRRTRQKVGVGIAGWVAEHGEPLLVNDIEQDPRFAQLASGARYPTKSLLSVPLATKAGVIGVINVNRKASGEAFTENDLELLMTFSSQAAAAIENAELYERVKGFNRELEEKVLAATAELQASNAELKLRLAELSTLYEASRAMGSTLNLRDVLATVMNEVAKLIPYDRGEICIWDEEAGELKVLAAVRGGEPLAVERSYAADESTSTGWIAARRQHLLVEAVGQGPALPLPAWQGEGNGFISSYVGVPLLKGERLVGTFELGSQRARAFTADHLRTLTALASSLAVAIDHAHLWSEQQRNTIDTLRSLVSMIEARDEYTRNHSERVTRLAVLIAKQMGLPERQVSLLRVGGALHDIGKMGMPDAILKSGEKLTPEQRKAMEQHPAVGAKILEPIRFLRGIRGVVLSHQERYDGSGYPEGLVGEAIPLEARILAVADTYDAMISRRRYRTRGFTHGDVLEELQRNAGKQFDPKVVDTLLSLGDEAFRSVYGELAAVGGEGAPAAAASQAPTPPPTVVVACPRCGARFRVDKPKIPAAGAKFRCLKCKEVLLVKPGGAQPAEAATPSPSA